MIWGKAEEQNICSYGKKREASWIGAKSPNRGKSTNAKKQAGLGKKLKNRIFAPTGRRKKQAGLGEKAQIEENPPT